jgi:glycolate oxidase
MTPRFVRLDDGVLGRLREELGEGGLITAGDPLDRYSRDETEGLSFPPAAVALPSTAEQVARVLRLTHEAGVPVTPRGGGTGLSGGALAVHGGLVLSLERLDRIRAIDSHDMVVEAEAGVATGELHEAVEAQGLFYPPDPSSLASCHLGGNLAEDAAGPRSLRYGTTRQWVLGLEAVLPDGRPLRTGGRNRKDAAGYNLTQLLVGSEGTLAVITAAVLRLLPLPGATMSLLMPFGELESAAGAVEELCRTGDSLAACELVERRGIHAVAGIAPVPSALLEQEAVLFLELHGSHDEELLEAAARLAEVAERWGGAEVQAAQDAAEQRRLWAIRRQVGEALMAGSAYREADAVVPRSQLANLVRAARRVAAAHGLEVVCFGHAGDGNLHIDLLQGALPEERWRVAREAAQEELLDEVLSLGGSITGEHGVGWTLRGAFARTCPPEKLSLMRGVKELFDPRGLLNPGKIFTQEGA